MKWRERSLDDIATLICGNTDGKRESYFPYRSSSYLTRFFRDADTDYAHAGHPISRSQRRRPHALDVDKKFH